MQGSEEKTKKVWEEPKLFVHGDVERITQTQKGLGFGDGFLWNIVPTRNIS